MSLLNCLSTAIPPRHRIAAPTWALPSPRGPVSWHHVAHLFVVATCGGQRRPRRPHRDRLPWPAAPRRPGARTVVGSQYDPCHRPALMTSAKETEDTEAVIVAAPRVQADLHEYASVAPSLARPPTSALAAVGAGRPTSPVQGGRPVLQRRGFCVARRSLGPRLLQLSDDSSRRSAARRGLGHRRGPSVGCLVAPDPDGPRPLHRLNTPRRVAPAPPSTLKPAFPDPGDRQDPDPENVPGCHPKAHHGAGGRTIYAILRISRTAGPAHACAGHRIIQWLPARQGH